MANTNKESEDATMMRMNTALERALSTPPKQHKQKPPKKPTKVLPSSKAHS